MKKISKNFLLVAFFLISTILYIGVLTFTPQEQGEISGLDVSSSVNIYSDNFGIPHIKADSEEDAYKALGFITARDRLFQMDVFRRMIQGRLSEIFGEKTINADKLLRTLRFKKHSELVLSNIQNSLDSQLMNNVNSYLEGVHFYIDNKTLPLEFHLLGYKPEKFEVSDMIGISGYMALTFAEAIIQDVLYSRLKDILPARKLQVLDSNDQGDNLFYDNSSKLFPETEEFVLKGIEELKSVLPLFYGSNSWVLAGKRTESGFPILANDPHIAIGNPHIFYEAHIQTPDFEIYGNYIPLIPFAIMGHTPYSGWAITMAELDDLNIYEEQIDFEKNKVLYKGDWQDLIIEKEIIKIKGGKEQELLVYRTPHGPLLNNTKFGDKEKNLALWWSVYHPENDILTTLYELPKAQNVEEFKASLQHAASPSLNISWAHKDGAIAWWVLGKYPKFSKNINTKYLLKGWNGEHDFENYYSFEENPHEINPESGVIVTANYKPWLKAFEHFQGYWQPSGRFHRIHKLLDEKEKWNLDALKKVQTDNILPGHAFFKEKLSKSINKEFLTKKEKQVFQKFLEWDGAHDIESVGATIFNTWSQKLIKNIFQDEMGRKNFNSFTKLAEYWNSYKKILTFSNHSFWDNINTKKIETMNVVTTDSFKETVEWLESEYGMNHHLWKWGRVHRVSFSHFLGKVKPLDYLYNREKISVPGGRYLINNLGHNKTDAGFNVVHGPATRRLIDFNDVRNSFGIIPLGNSGNPFSTHYGDQTSLYKKNQYRKQLMNWEEIEKLKVLKIKGGH